jgi:uncharacterized oxidoreductase
MELSGRTVLVTGGARGIGRELTARLVGLGADVVAVGRNPETLAGVAAEFGGRVTAMTADLADPDAVDTLCDTLPERFPALSVVINNAGVQSHGDLTASAPGDLPEIRRTLRRELAVNLDAVITLSAGLLPHLRALPSGAIVNVSSGLAVIPKASAPVYCAAKSAVRTFTRALRYQCEDSAPGVAVFDAVLPLVDTDMTAGRGRSKISAAAAAGEILDGIRRGRPDIYVGKTRLLPHLMRVAPSAGYRIMRHV